MQTLIDYALSHVGIAYIWGGDDPVNGYDCSGFIQECLQSVGIDPKGDQTAHGLYTHFKKVGTPGQVKAGSLAFYGKHDKVSHVGLFIDSWRIVEAAGGNSKTINAKQAALQNAYIRVRPFDYRRDFIEAINPIYPPRMKPLAL